MRFCVISTGGTIASSPGDEGLTPTMRGEQLLSHIPDLQRSGSVSVVDLLSKDSSNMHPDDWARIARCVLERRDKADGFLILHGTDTMAYTASALSYMLLGFDRPVVLTGSMHPIDVPGTDAIDNVPIPCSSCASWRNGGRWACPSLSEGSSSTGRGRRRS